MFVQILRKIRKTDCNTELFSTFLLNILKIGCLGFGGGSALIPIFEDVFVGENKLDTKENFDKDIIVASLTPGALPIEIASSIGKRNFGNYFVQIL